MKNESKISKNSKKTRNSRYKSLEHAIFYLLTYLRYCISILL